MTISKQFLVVRDGGDENQIEDAAASDTARGRFAISDGASTSGFSDVWAQILVDSFVHQSEAELGQWDKWIPDAQAQWRKELADVEIPWFGEAQFEKGAYATFLGIIVQEDHEGNLRYMAEAIGDSCLFHVRDHELLRTFPLEQSSEFDNFPDLIGSRSPIDKLDESCAKRIEGVARTGDQFMLMSDALAQWAFLEYESNRPVWDEIRAVIDSNQQMDEKFRSWIAELRNCHALHNDDVTLMIINLDA